MCPKESNITTRSIPHIHTLRTDFFFPHSQGRGIQHLPDGNPGYCQQLEALMFGERAQQLANVEINPHPPPPSYSGSPIEPCSGFNPQPHFWGEERAKAGGGGGRNKPPFVFGRPPLTSPRGLRSSAADPEPLSRPSPPLGPSPARPALGLSSSARPRRPRSSPTAPSPPRAASPRLLSTPSGLQGPLRAAGGRRGLRRRPKPGLE